MMVLADHTKRMLELLPSCCQIALSDAASQLTATRMKDGHKTGQLTRVFLDLHDRQPFDGFPQYTMFSKHVTKRDRVSRIP